MCREIFSESKNYKGVRESCETWLYPFYITLPSKGHPIFLKNSSSDSKLKTFKGSLYHFREILLKVLLYIKKKKSYFCAIYLLALVLPFRPIPSNIITLHSTSSALPTAFTSPPHPSWPHLLFSKVHQFWGSTVRAELSCVILLLGIHGITQLWSSGSSTELGGLRWLHSGV